MRSLSILVFSLFSSTISSAPSSVRSPAVYSSAASLPFTFTPAFTAKIKLGSPSHPISVPGGVLVNQATTGGTVTGSVLNATIQGGFAHPSDIKDEGERGNVTVQLPTIDIYGKTDDGEDLYLHEVGIGSPEGQVTRIVSGISRDM